MLLKICKENLPNFTAPLKKSIQTISWSSAGAGVGVVVWAGVVGVVGGVEGDGVGVVADEQATSPETQASCPFTRKSEQYWNKAQSFDSAS